MYCRSGYDYEDTMSRICSVVSRAMSGSFGFLVSSVELSEWHNTVFEAESIPTVRKSQ
jgi:hypothetical protein